MGTMLSRTAVLLLVGLGRRLEVQQDLQ